MHDRSPVIVRLYQYLHAWALPVHTLDRVGFKIPVKNLSEDWSKMEWECTWDNELWDCNHGFFTFPLASHCMVEWEKWHLLWTSRSDHGLTWSQDTFFLLSIYNSWYMMQPHHATSYFFFMSYLLPFSPHLFVWLITDDSYDISIQYMYKP